MPGHSADGPHTLALPYLFVNVNRVCASPLAAYHAIPSPSKTRQPVARLFDDDALTEVHLGDADADGGGVHTKLVSVRDDAGEFGCGPVRWRFIRGAGAYSRRSLPGSAARTASSAQRTAARVLAASPPRKTVAQQVRFTLRPDRAPSAPLPSRGRSNPRNAVRPRSRQAGNANWLAGFFGS